ncbi:hypothetical protein QAD02_022704 [Eretmocerus hayati]|uniref:Uncharacterized protein n=1 Tax=Eretmocerus hayati TaxID=131215 RepID=A0ACC2PYN4_9HYME|nr:hypothetical protein QAD02_022704 [Eretmocerus hayati]
MFFLAIAIIMSVDSVSSQNDVYFDLVKLISEYHDEYSAPHIFIARGENLTDFRLSHSFIPLIKNFSEKNVYSTMAKIEDIENITCKCRERKDRPNFVVLISSMQDFASFEEVTKKLERIRTYKTLVLFSKNMLALCKSPIGNPFHLTFDSQMYVKCQGDPIIREWYSLHKNETKFSDLYRWTRTTGRLIPLTNRTFYERRDSLEGIDLHLATTEAENMTGVFSTIIKDISHRANFNIIPHIKDVPGSWEPNTTNWHGVIGELQDRHADMGIAFAGLAMTQSRMNIVDFSRPVFISNSEYYLRNSQEVHLIWSMYHNAIGAKAGYCLLAVLLLSPIVVIMTSTKKDNANLHMIVYDSYFNVWGIFCSKPLPGSMTLFSARIAYFSLFTLSFVLYSIYSTLLVSYFTFLKPELPFNCLRGFRDASSHNITTLKHSYLLESIKNSNDATMRTLRDFLVDEELMPGTFEELVQQVCDVNQHIVVYADNFLMQLHDIPCYVSSFGMGQVNNQAIAFVKHSNYVGLFNH